MAEEESIQNQIVSNILAIVCANTNLSIKDTTSLLLLNRTCYNLLNSHPTLWQTLDLRESNKAGEKLIAALSLERYRHVKKISLEFAREVEDEHFIYLKSKENRRGGKRSIRNGFKSVESLHNLESLNINGCQKISDKGVEAIASICPILKSFSIYWNIRITDLSIKHLVNNCREITDLNFSGCKSLSDQSLSLIADNYQELEALNITRCLKLTDAGLNHILLKCSRLQILNLYALSSFTDKAYNNIACLAHLKFLDLCGAQNLSDHGLSSIAMCKNLLSLNLTWCVRITDMGMEAIAQSCKSLEFLSLFGITGVTDKCLEALSKFCSKTLTTLDVNGCIGIKRRSREDLLKLFPNLTCFKVHS